MGEAETWEALYLADVTNWDLGGPATPLVRAAASLRPGTAVFPGSGKGHDALFFAQIGFAVTAVDFAPGAVKATRKAALARGLGVEVLEGDILALPGRHAPWDYWVEHTCFCAIDPSQREAYVAAAHRSLVPGGHLLALHYTHRRPGGPPFGTTREEVERRFSPHFELVSIEVPADSHPKRAGEELLALWRRRGGSS